MYFELIGEITHVETLPPVHPFVKSRAFESSMGGEGGESAKASPRYDLVTGLFAVRRYTGTKRPALVAEN
jgi:hypothetical protein